MHRMYGIRVATLSLNLFFACVPGNGVWWLNLGIGVWMLISLISEKN